MVMKLVVLGHSFVSRLEDFVNSSPDNRVTKNLNLSLEEIHVSYAGFRGATLSKVRAQGLRYVRLFHPDVVVLQAVSNDLCDPTKSVSDVFKQLIDFVISLRYAESVKHDVILQTLHRRPPSYRIRYEVDTQWFNERVDELNMRISSYLCNVEGSKFFRLSGFWSSTSQDMVFSQDGVHLNLQGMKKYYNNLRAVVVSTLKTITNDERTQNAKRQPRGRRTQVIPAAAGSAEQAAQQTVQQTAQDQLVAAVTDKVLEAIRNESNQESQQMVETEDRGRKKHKEPKKKRKRISSPPRSPSIAGTNSDLIDSSGDENSSDENTSTDVSSSAESDNDDNYLLSTPISAQVETKIKNKIWQNKYIDFSKLLPREDIASDRSVQLKSTGNSELKLLSTKSKTLIKSIDQWTSAFLKFLAIYSEKFPKQVASVIKHGEIVRELANRHAGLSWLTYAKQVRKDIEARSIPWGQLHYEYWVMASTSRNFHHNFQTHFRTKHNFQRRGGPQKGRKRPPGFCYAFHRNGKCYQNNCQYKHTCYQCKKNHSALQCPRGNQSAPNNSSPSYPSSSFSSATTANK